MLDYLVRAQKYGSAALIRTISRFPCQAASLSAYILQGTLYSWRCVPV